MRVVGVDPGFKGGLGLIDSVTREVVVIDMPVRVMSSKRVRVKKGKKKGTMRQKDRRIVCGKGVADWIEEVQPNIAVVELVGSRPGEGVSSVFAFGSTWGAVIAAIEAMNVQVVFVTPASWKRGVGLIGKDKSASLTLARKRYKKVAHHLSLRKHEGRAEALLIADDAISRLVH